MRSVVLLGLVLVTSAHISSGEPQAQRELVGCPELAEVKQTVAELATVDWRTFDRARVIRRWKGELEYSAREPGSNEVLGIDVHGREIRREIQCGQSFLFASDPARSNAPATVAPDDPYRLRVWNLWHAERADEDAIALARTLIDLSGAPKNTKGSWTYTLDARETRKVLFEAEYAWRTERYRLVLSVRVVRGDQASIVEVRWARDMPGATP